MGRPVTRMMTRVLQRAGIAKLSHFSVIIMRNRRYDALALPLRNVIVQRRMSDQPVQQPQRIRRLSLAVSQQPPSMNQANIQQADVDQSGDEQSALNNTVDSSSSGIFQSDIEMDEVQTANSIQDEIDQQSISGVIEDNSSFDHFQSEMDEIPSTSSAIPHANNEHLASNVIAISSSVDNSPLDIEMNEIETNDAECSNDEVSIGGEQNNDGMPVDHKNGGQENVTTFPGHVKKSGRKSFFDRSDMDQYVLKFQPSKPLQRRHSMLENRPPLSRMNRFSLDSIREEREIDVQQELTTSKGTTSKATTSKATTSKATTSSSEMPTGSGGPSTVAADAADVPMYPRIRWRIPDLIPISRRHL